MHTADVELVPQHMNEDKGREGGEPSTPIRGTSTIVGRQKTGKTTGGGEKLKTGADEVTGAGIRYERTGEQGQDGKPESEEATATKEEEADAEVGVTTREGHETKHALRPEEGQGMSMHPEEWQRVTDDDGWVKPLRGKRGMKDGTTKHQDQQHGLSAIGMSEESYLRKWGRCVENGGLRTGKGKCGVPKDMRGQSGRAQRVFLGAKWQHRRLRRSPKRRAPMRKSGKLRTWLKRYTERSRIRRTCEANRAETARVEAW
jgi:hypothetical protein